MSSQQNSITRHSVKTPSGRISYVSAGSGPVALFVHGVLVNKHLWRHQTAALPDIRRCIAVDLLAHGDTEIDPSQDVSVTANAHMLREFLDALRIDQVDLIGNDSGGGIAQIFAALNPERVRTLALTNCDAHDNWPPEAFGPIVDLARSGALVEAVQALAIDPDAARSALASGLEDPAALPDEVVASFFARFADRSSAEALQAYVAGMDSAVTVAVRDDLARFDRPTLIVWATADDFFDVRWAHWLAETIPGTVRCVELAGAKLFFPLERPEFTSELRAFWSELDRAEVGAA